MVSPLHDKLKVTNYSIKHDKLDFYTLIYYENKITQIYGEEYISEADWDRGLRSFEVRPIRDIEDLPYNIYPCFETNPIKAQQEMYLAINTPPYNTAIWLAGAAYDDTTTTLKRLESLSFSIDLRKGDDVSLLDTDDGYTVKNKLRTKFGRSLDRKPIILWNQNKGSGTWLVDNDALKFYTWKQQSDPRDELSHTERQSVYNNGKLPTPKDGHVVFHEIPSGVPIMMRTDAAQGLLCGHTTPCRISGTPLNRKLWLLRPDLDDNVLQFYEDNFEGFSDKLATDARHQNIVQNRPELIYD